MSALLIYCDASISHKRKCRIGWYAECGGEIVAHTCKAVPIRADHGQIYMLELYSISDSLLFARSFLTSNHVSRIQVHTDCDSVVKVLSGVGKSRGESKSLYEAVGILIASFPVPCSIEWMSRFKNEQSKAHRLSGEFFAPNQHISELSHQRTTSALRATISEYSKVYKKVNIK